MAASHLGMTVTAFTIQTIHKRVDTWGISSLGDFRIFGGTLPSDRVKIDPHSKTETKPESPPAQPWEGGWGQTRCGVGGEA